MANNFIPDLSPLAPGDLARSADINERYENTIAAFDKLPAPAIGQTGFSEPLPVGEPINPDHAVTKNYLEVEWLTAADKAQLNSINLTNLDTVAGSVSNVNTVAGSIFNVNTLAAAIANVNSLAGSVANVNILAPSAANIDTLAASVTNVNTAAINVADINTVATNIANVNATGSSISNVNAVATDIANVNTTATSIADVNTVAGSIINVNNVGGSIANVNTVSADLANVDTVAGSIGSVNTVGTNIANVNIVGADLLQPTPDITTVADHITNVDTVAGSISSVDTVAPSIANVNTVSGAIANVNTTATNINSVNTVSSSIANVNTTATNILDVNTVAADLNLVTPSITTVATDIANVNTVAGISADVTSAASNSANITTVAGVAASVNTVAGISTDVTSVAANNANITTVATDLNLPTSNVELVAGSIANVNNVGGSIANVNTVSGSIANVNTVAADGVDIGTVSTNILNVNTVAGINSDVSTVASNTANIAQVVANITDIQNADTYAADAISAKNAAEAALDTFTDIFLGAKASDPTLDNDGNPLQVGAIYFSTTVNRMKVYNGSTWDNVSVSAANVLQVANNLSDLSNITTAKANLAYTSPEVSYDNTVSGIAANTVKEALDYLAAQAGNQSGAVASYKRQEFDATAGQTVFTITDGYTVGYVEVYKNGLLLDNSEFTANDGSTVVLATGASLNDEVNVICHDSFAIAELLRVVNISASAANNALTVDASNNLSVTGGVTAASFTGSGTALTGVLLEASNLSDLTNAATARTNLGLGTLATKSSIASGDITANAVGTTALNVSGTGVLGQALTSDADGSMSWTTLATVATTNNYSDLSGTPSLGTLAGLNSVNAATITDNSVGAAELNVTGNGTTTQYLRSDGDGTFTWATPPNTTYTGGTGLALTGTTFSLDFTELTDKITDIVGTTEFILNDAGTESRKAANEIKLSALNNDLALSAFSNDLALSSFTNDLGLATVATSGSYNDLSNLPTLGSLASLNTVGAAQITDNSVGALELNVSGNGTTSQYLRSDGDGTFTWATPTNTTSWNIQANSGTQINVSTDEEVNFLNGTDITVAITNQTNPTVTHSHNSVSRTNNTSSASPGYGGTFTAIDSITTSATGHVTAVNTKTVTIPASDNTDTWRPIHDTPVDGATTTSISSNWAFDNVKTPVPSGAVFTDTTYSAGTGLAASGTTFSLDFSELTDMVADISGTTEFILQNGTTESRKAANEIKLSAFNNDLGLATVATSGAYADLTGKPTLGTLAGLNTVNSTHIDADAVGSSEIAANAVGASELNVTGNGTNTQFLRSDGDGTFTWATPVNTTYSAGSGIVLTSTTFSIDTAVVVDQTSATGAANLPVGTTAQRPTAATGQIRYNTTEGQFEGYNGSFWGAIGGGATGAAGNAVFVENDQVVTASYTITSGKNAMSAGPVSIADGVAVTIPTGSTWTVV